MAPINPNKPKLKESFKKTRSIRSFYSGGTVRLDNAGLLYTAVGEEIVVLDLATGSEKFRLNGKSDAVTCFAVQPDSQKLVSGTRSLQLSVWDLTTATLIKSWRAHDAPVLTMDIDSSSTLVATGSADASIRVWDIERGFCTHVFRGHTGVISQLLFQGLTLFSGGEDGNIRVWDLNTKACKATLKNHVSVVRGLDLVDDTTLISASRDKVVCIWDLITMSIKRTIPVYEALETIAYLGDQRFVTAGEKGMLRIFHLYEDLSTQKQIQVTTPPHILTHLIFNSQLRSLLAVSSDHILNFFDPMNEFKVLKQMVGNNDEITDICYVGAQEKMIAVATNSAELKLFNLENFDCTLLPGHSDVIFCTDATEDGTLLATGSKDKTARLWGLASDAGGRPTFECLSVLSGHVEPVGAVALSRGQHPFLITGSQDRTVKLWDLSPIFMKKNASEPYAKLSFKAHDKDINAIVVSPRDKVFATASQDKTAKIWSVETGELLGQCQGHKRGVWKCHFSPVEQILATCSGDKTIKLWNLKDFTCMRTFEGHASSVLNIKFASFGAQLLSTDADGLIKLWTIKANQCTLTLDAHEDRVWALQVSSDETSLITGGADALIQFWEDSTEEEQLAQLKKETDALLREQDLSNYLLKKDYQNSIYLALSMQQPFRLIKIFRTILQEKEGPEEASSDVLDKVIATLGLDQVEVLLGYVRTWNAQAKTSVIAHFVFQSVLKSHSLDELLRIPTIYALCEAISAYTEQHIRRFDELLTQSFLLDYALHSINKVAFSAPGTGQEAYESLGKRKATS